MYEIRIFSLTLQSQTGPLEKMNPQKVEIAANLESSLSQAIAACEHDKTFVLVIANEHYKHAEGRRRERDEV